ncbi:MAG: PEP/pyruvate-binding domain-containing protein [Bacteroidota bacterium]
MRIGFALLVIILWSGQTFIFSQKKSNEEIRVLVDQYQTDDRGPYKDIRWFCKDGRINLPKEPCGEKGGVQRARYKDAVESLAKSNHIFLGQILSTTDFADFWDAPNAHSRLKQYQLEKFLRAADNGWVLRKGQFYRGAIQVEDEEQWGIDFFNWLLKNDKIIKSHFYLTRQAVKDIPHAGDNDRTQSIRALSKSISETHAPFMDLRIKIHGQPDASDIAASKDFLEKHQSKMSKKNIDDFNRMLRDMEIVYQPVDLTTLRRFVHILPKDNALRQDLEQYISKFKNQDFSTDKMEATAAMLFGIRKNLLEVKSSKSRLALLDVSLALENILFQNIAKWETPTYVEMMQKIQVLARASVGYGYLEMWEWEKLKSQISIPQQEESSVQDLLSWHEAARSLVEWATGTTRGVYRTTVDLFGGFEPLAFGFYDDKIRSSILLPLGNAVSDLGNAIAVAANFSNQIFDFSNTSNYRGLNPGYALGELVVVSGNAEAIEVAKDKIYIFHHPASDLKPVAGIATVSEGNMVSHVQLLARNLGIPNAVLSEENLNELKKYSGKKVFYAVSNKGTVLMKLEKEMTEEERKLFEVKKRSQEKIAVPVEKIQLDKTAVLPMRDVRAKDSGKLCGPKAANLGQLKAMFPDKVVEGIVIPFGIFKAHMDEPMPEQTGSYWEFLNNTFTKAHEIKDETKAEEFMLRELAIFRAAIKKIHFKRDFVKDLKQSFETNFDSKIGTVPVFLRSDTNMEDLKSFTGAGLNLTLFNVLEEEKILQGIRDVWASPYTERSYKWRQKYLLNPENVYPSILIIPSVDVDYSGVVITKGITSGKDDDVTVAFSRGAGGAVDGQAAESWLLTSSGKNILLSPAREPFYRRLPTAGGTSNNNATFEQRILNNKNLQAIRDLTEEINNILPSTEGVETEGPFDVELGFQNDKMWLFQIRPFVENKNAKSSEYLASITPQIPTEVMVKTNLQIDEANAAALKDYPLTEEMIAGSSKGEESANNWLTWIIVGMIGFVGVIYLMMQKRQNHEA